MIGYGLNYNLSFVWCVVTWSYQKININSLLLGTTFLCLIYLTLTKGSVIPNDTSGNYWLDFFVYISSSLSTNIGGIVFTMIFVISYVDVMKALRSTDVLTYLL